MQSSRAFAAAHADQVGSPIVLFSPAFTSSKSSIKEAVVDGFAQLDEEQASMVSKMEGHVKRRLRTDNVQDTVRKYNLTHLEAESVLWYTADFRTLDHDVKEDFNVYYQFNLALRNRSPAGIKPWRDFAWFLVNALRKLPPAKVDVFRGVPQRITALSSNYAKGKQVVWTSFTSTTVNRDEIMKSFGKGGTFMHIEVLDGRDIGKLSMLPHEQEVLLMPNVHMLVDSVLSANEAAKFSTKFGGALPRDVDLILMREVETNAGVKQDSTPFDSHCERGQAVHRVKGWQVAGAGASPAASSPANIQEVDAELAAMLAQSGISSLAASLAAHGFTTAEEVRELAEEDKYLAELVAQLGLTLRDKMRLDKMLKTMQAFARINAAYPDVKTPADLDKHLPGTDYTVLWACASNGKLELVEDCILAGCNVNISHADGFTPLYIAAQLGHVPVVERLIAARCAVDTPEANGATPLFIAAENGHEPVVERLIAARCAVDTPAVNGFTPLSIAAENGHEPVVERLIAARCAVDTPEVNGFTPLHIAAHAGHVPVVERLIAARCAVDTSAKDAHTPLMCAARFGRVEAVRALVKAGADRRSFGTALQYARGDVGDKAKLAELERILK